MTTCNCIVQAGQIAEDTESALRARLEDFAQSNFGSAAEISWLEIPAGSGYTAAQPSTSSIVSLVADKPLEQSTRVDMLEQLCALWMDQTNCSLDEIVGVINDPVPS